MSLFPETKSIYELIEGEVFYNFLFNEVNCLICNKTLFRSKIGIHSHLRQKHFRTKQINHEQLLILLKKLLG